MYNNNAPIKLEKNPQLAGAYPRGSSELENLHVPRVLGLLGARRGKACALLLKGARRLCWGVRQPPVQLVGRVARAPSLPL